MLSQLAVSRRLLLVQLAVSSRLLLLQLAIFGCLLLLQLSANRCGIPQLTQCVLQTVLLATHKDIANGPRKTFDDDFVRVVLIVPGSACSAEFPAVTFIGKPTEPRMHRVAAVRVHDGRHFRKAPAVNALIHIDNRWRSEIERARHRAAPSAEKELVRQDVARLYVGGHPGRVLRRDPKHVIRDPQFLYQRSGLSDGFAPIYENSRGARTRGFD